jgi:hypothetical protein
MSTGGNRDRLRALEAQLEQLRGPAVAPSQAPPPLAPGRVQPTLLVLVEMAVNYLALGELDAARTAIGEAAPLFHEVKDAATLAKASLYIGEVLIALDAPKHAHERLVTAMGLYEKLGDARSVARARMGLGRSLVLLEDPEGLMQLEEARVAFQDLSDASAVAQVESAIRDANEGMDAHGRIRAGYGRTVSMMPAPLK